MLPFLACPLGLALKRWPGPTVALAGASIAAWTIVDDHPPAGRLRERDGRSGRGCSARANSSRRSRRALGAGRGWGGIWPFLLALAGARRARGGGDAAAAPDAGRARRRPARAARPGRCSPRSPPPRSGSTTRGCSSIVKAGRPDGAEPAAAQRHPLSADAARRSTAGSPARSRSARCGSPAASAATAPSDGARRAALPAARRRGLAAARRRASCSPS